MAGTDVCAFQVDLHRGCLLGSQLLLAEEEVKAEEFADCKVIGHLIACVLNR